MSGKYSNIKVVSFDMDGTILNTEADLEAAARRALKLAGLPPMPPVRFANYIGNGVKGIYRELCPDATQEKLEEAVRYQLEWYPEHCTEQTCFYPGMWETLQWMAAKGIRLVIVTNKVETTAKKLANHFCSDLPFEEIWGNDHDRPLKPDPIAGKLLCETLGVTPDQVMHVGDGETDMQFAKNAGFVGVGVSWGYRSTDVLWESGADVMIDEPWQLCELLDR